MTTPRSRRSAPEPPGSTVGGPVGGGTGGTVPDVASVVAGWRRWRVEDGLGGTRLVSPVRSSPWPARVATTAWCRYGRHDAPAAACRCGLYATTDLSTLLRAFSPGAVLGLTALWGRVVAGERGWRAEHGHPLVLFTEPSVRERTRARLARRYGLPVHALPGDLERLVVADRARVEADAVAVRTAAVRGGTPDAPVLSAAVPALLATLHAVAERSPGPL